MLLKLYNNLFESVCICRRRRVPVPTSKVSIYGPRPNTGFYGRPHVDQSECRILQSHVIKKYTKFANFARLYFPHFTIFRNYTNFRKFLVYVTHVTNWKIFVKFFGMCHTRN